MRFTLLAVSMSLFLPFALYGQGDLFSSNYLNGGSGGTAADYLNDSSSGFQNFDDYLASISIDNYLDNQDNNGGNTDVDVDDTGNDNEMPTNTDPGGTNPNETNIDLLNQNTNRPLRNITNDTVIDHLDPYYWREWRDSTETNRVQPIHQGTYSSPNSIAIETSPWSYTYWPMSDCGLAFTRLAALNPQDLKSQQDVAKDVHKLSALELYDTYVYNKYGTLPCAAAFEAHPHKHNTRVWSQRRLDENSDKVAHFWIVWEKLHKLNRQPFQLRMRDGRTHEQRTANDPEIVTYQTSVGNKTFSIQARLTMAERKYFPNVVVEEFRVPFEAANGIAAMGIQGMDTQYEIIMIDERGNPIMVDDGRGNKVARTQKLSWQQIQANPQLARRHKRAEDPKFIRLFRTIHMYEHNGQMAVDLSKSVNWYCLQYHVKPGSLHHGWWGHCNGWSAASIKVPLPRHNFPIRKSFGNKKIKVVRLKLKRAVEAMSPSGEPTVKISRDDYEIIETNATTLFIQPAHYFGVATELWNDCDTNIMNRPDAFYTSLRERDFQGNRYDGSTSNQELANKYMSDIYPNHFFSLLMHHVKEKKEGIVCDIHKGTQVWNKPVRAFRYTHRFQATPNDEVAAGFYVLGLHVDYVPYGNLWHFEDPNRYKVAIPANRWKKYIARLYVDKKTHRIYRGEWSRGTIAGESVDSIDDHPDFCWVPISPKVNYVRDQNEKVNDDHASEMIKLE